MDKDDLVACETAVAGLLTKLWGEATDAGTATSAGFRELWGEAAAQGWFDLEDAVDAVLALQRQLGGVACPFPVAAGFFAVPLAPPLPAGGAWVDRRLPLVPDGVQDQQPPGAVPEAPTPVLSSAP